MSDLRMQRNLAIGVALVAVALLVGFGLGRVGRPSGPQAPEIGAAPAAPASVLPSPTAEPAAVAMPTAVPVSPASSFAEPTAIPAAPRLPTPTPRPAAATKAPKPAPTPRDEPPAATAEPTKPPAPQPVTVTVPAGSEITLALVSAVSSQSSAVGDAVAAELTTPLVVDGKTALAAGTRLNGRVTEAVRLAKVGGQAKLALAFESAEVDGREVPIEAYFARQGKSETGKDAATIAAGAAIGVILGNQAKKNDRGKVVGGVVGAAAGAAAAAATKGETVELPVGTELRLTLRSPVTVTR